MEATQRSQQDTIERAMATQSQQMTDALSTAFKESKTRKTLADPRDSKPEKFNNTESGWEEFSWAVFNHCGSIWGKEARQALLWAEHDMVEINEGRINRQFEQIDSEIPWDDIQLFNSELHSFMMTRLTGEAKKSAKSISEGNGLEVWRRLTNRWDPYTIGRRRSLVSRLMNPGNFKDNELMEKIIDWENEVARYEQRPDSTGVKVNLPDDLKTGVLQDMARGALKKHLYMHAGRLIDYDHMRDEIKSYLEASQGPGDTKGDGKGGVVPMDVDWLGKAGKAKGKGKGAGKGGKDNGGKGGYQDNQGNQQNHNGGYKNPHADKICDFCKKKGHIKKNCWSSGGPNSTPKGKGKGYKGDKGKGKGHGGKGKAAKGKSKGQWSLEWDQATWENPNQQNHDTYWQPEKEIDGLEAQDMNLFEKDDSSEKDNGTEKDLAVMEKELFGLETKIAEAGYERIDVTVDSGAAASASFKSLIDNLKVHSDGLKQRYNAVTGSQVDDIGYIKIRGLSEEWHPMAFKFRVTEPEIQKTVLSVAESVDAFNKVVFDHNWSYIYNKKSKTYSTMHRVNNVYKLPVWVKVEKPDKDAMEIDAVEQERLMMMVEKMLAAINGQKDRIAATKAAAAEAPSGFSRPVLRIP